VSTPHIDLPEEEIAQRAYELWQARGCPQGEGDQDWEAAKEQLLAERGRVNIWYWWGRVREKLTGRAAAL
jgi:Protein of unknown function (DUF2934)